MVCQAYYIVWREIMNKQKFHNVMKWIIFVIYMCLLIYVVFFAESMGRTSQTRHIYNLEPFKEIKRFWKYILDNDSLGRIARLNENKWVGGKPAFGYKVNKHGKFEIDEEEAIIVKDIFKLIATTLYSFSLSLAIELTQLITMVGSCDVDDLILNCLGGLTGYIIYAVWYKIIRRED